MLFNIEINQILTGYVTINSSSAEGALEIANSQFNQNGMELPDMDDLDELSFSVAPFNRPCTHYRKFGNCVCNNDEDSPGECIYEDGIPDGYGLCEWAN